MFQLRNAFSRLMKDCPKCHGSGQTGVFKMKPCSKCGGTGQIKARPSWVGPAVVFGFIVCLAILMGIAFLTAKPASANELSGISNPPQLEIVVEKTGPVTSEESTWQDAAPCHVSPNYPEGIMQWCELITKYAHANDIPSDMIAAVMLQESGGDSEAYSSSGAVGLMQVMPRDGIAVDFQCINGPCFASRPTIKELQDPEFNISYGAGMLTKLYNKFGDWREALKEYGPQDYGYGYADIVLKIFENYK